MEIIVIIYSKFYGTPFLLEREIGFYTLSIKSFLKLIIQGGIEI